jgi:hypothetical protein
MLVGADWEILIFCLDGFKKGRGRTSLVLPPACVLRRCGLRRLDRCKRVKYNVIQVIFLVVDCDRLPDQQVFSQTRQLGRRQWCPQIGFHLFAELRFAPSARQKVERLRNLKRFAETTCLSLEHEQNRRLMTCIVSGLRRVSSPSRICFRRCLPLAGCRMFSCNQYHMAVSECQRQVAGFGLSRWQ